MSKHESQKTGKLHRVLESSETENEINTLYSGKPMLNLETYKIMQRSGSIPSALVNDLRILNGHAKSQSEYQEMYEALCKAMDMLKEKEFQVIALYYYEEMSMIEISSVLDKSELEVAESHAEALRKLNDL
ncbi:MAG: hypothetical protein CMI58_05015 [Parcubacteria group bacterium]|nr:hypothetical protein [Parcubacteria group bacterium]|tara:strand:+ start:3060 stop:3452 length:393 start_codon:yes stop_codon:yes gene_type:complete